MDSNKRLKNSAEVSIQGIVLGDTSQGLLPYHVRVHRYLAGTVSGDLTSRLWRRFFSNDANKNLPHSRDRFERELIALLKSKITAVSNGEVDYQVTSKLYQLWKASSFITVELFADSVNESGVLDSYCSKDDKDRVFGSIGSWEQNENFVIAGGCNPPFEKPILHEVVDKFERSSCEEHSYCRVAILPLNKKYGVMDRVYEGMTGCLLVQIPPSAGLGFKSQRQLLQYSERRNCDSSHWKLSLGLFVWTRRSFLIQHPPPLDIELGYVSWVAESCRRPNEVVYHWDAFERAFPRALRNSTEIATIFD